MHSPRINWIDVARGIGILLVIYGHALTSESYRYIIYSFHMPLFFFLSGIVFHVRNYEHFGLFLRKTIKNILFPYFLFAFLSFVLWLFFMSPQERNMQFILYEFGSIFYGSGNYDLLIFNNVLWFLPCVFVTKIAFSLITKTTKRRRYILLALLLSSLIGYGLSIYLPKIALPMGLEIVPTVLVFFGAGYLWNRHNEKIKHHFEKHSFTLFIFFAIATVILATINYNLNGHQQLDLRLNILNNYFFTYLAAFSGIFTFVALSTFIQKNKLLEFLGKQSLVLFGWHLVVFSLLTGILLHFITPETIEDLHNDVLAPAYTFSSIGLILFMSFLFNNLKSIFTKKP